MASYNSQANPGLFVPSTNVWDVSQISSIDINSPEFRELLIRLYQNINLISIVLNLKDSAYYVLEEFLNSQAFFPNPALNSTTAASPVYRQAFRMTVNFGALPNGTKSVPHNIAITNTYSFTRIYATASDQSGMNYIPIPYASSNAADIIEINVDATDVNITTASDKSNFTICYVILEYIKQ